ncbi:MAG: hypothetical protein ACRENE_07920 [Polyangiaceae bacterium]
MKSWKSLIVAGSLVGCSSNVIDAGTNDAGSKTAVGGEAVVVASRLQIAPSHMVSDGTWLYWVMPGDGASISPGLFRMPVGGGAIVNLTGNRAVGPWLLAVDDVSVYFVVGQGPVEIMAAPKETDGGSFSVARSLTTATSAWGGATVLGDKMFWTEVSPSYAVTDGDGGPDHTVTAYVAPLRGGPPAILAHFSQNLNPAYFPSVNIAVTTSTAFLGSPSSNGLESFPIAAGYFPADGGMTQLIQFGFLRMAPGCQIMLSDTNAVYCDTGTKIVSVASDGTLVVLGDVVGPTGVGSVAGGTVAYDDTHVYWTNAIAPGTIMRAPKTGGPAVVLARDAEPLAIAADSKAVYWSDAAGNIMRLDK